MKMLLVLTILFNYIFIYDGVAQQPKNFLKASSPKVFIKDGVEGKTGYWNHLIKSKVPIRYQLANSQKERPVTFYTNLDSITINISPESDYSLNVIYASDTLPIILTTRTNKLEAINDQTKAVDSIPFTFNKNFQIILKGSINDSPPIDFCLDLGARMIYVIGKSLDQSNKITIDGLMEDESVTGLATEKTSSTNKLKIGNRSTSNLQICYIDEPGFLEAGGGLIGFNIFQNCIIEIDFDQQLLMIHDRLPQKITQYSSLDFLQTTGGIYIPITISNGNTNSEGWYFFDTGADNALAIDSKSDNKNILEQGVNKIGEALISSSESRRVKADIFELPEVKIAGFTFKNVPTLLATESNSEASIEDGVIGIVLQKRFNLIIDFPKNKMYLRPSKFFSDSFKKKENKSLENTLVLAILALLTASAFLILILRRKKYTAS
jgi:Aspartyl protease